MIWNASPRRCAPAEGIHTSTPAQPGTLAPTRARSCVCPRSHLRPTVAHGEDRLPLHQTAERGGPCHHWWAAARCGLLQG
jgi:hypothetical protein